MKSRIAATFLLFCFLSASLSGCGGSGGSAAPSPSASTSSGQTAAPSALQAGTVMSVSGGPAITLTDTSNFSYSNSGSNAFTASVTGGGWYYYASGTTGYITLTGNGATDSKVFSGTSFRTQATLTNFGYTNGNLATATLTASGSSYTVTFTGTANAAPTTAASSGTTSFVIPSAITGTYQWVAGNDQTGSPYTDGTKVSVEIQADGSLYINGALVSSSPTLSSASSAGAATVYYVWTAGSTSYLAQVTGTGATLSQLSIVSGSAFVGNLGPSSSFTTPTSGTTTANLLNPVQVVVTANNNPALNTWAVGMTGTFQFTTVAPSGAGVALQINSTGSSTNALVSNANGSSWSSSVLTFSGNATWTQTANVNTQTQTLTTYTIIEAVTNGQTYTTTLQAIQ